MKPIYILNGPNLNQLGVREPDIYGDVTLEQIESLCEERAKSHGFSIDFKQSNEEGVLINLIQEAAEKGAGLVINAGAYTHTSVAIYDALRMSTLPAIEVHLSNVFAREPFRHHSYISPAVLGVICGLGPNGYLLAIDALAEKIK